jgi:hypothetical protein
MHLLPRPIRLGLVLGALSFGLLAFGGIAPAAVKCSPTSLDLGLVPQDKSVTAAFWIKNPGPRTVQLRLRSDALFEARLSNARVARGDSGSIIFSLKPRALVGRLWGTISLYTNDPALPRKDLRVTAEVVRAAPPAIEMLETSFDFGRIEQGAKVDHVFQFRNVGGRPLKILEVHPDCGCTVADFTQVVPPGAKGAIKVHFDSTGKNSYQYHKVSVSTDDPSNPQLMLEFRGDVAVLVSVDPLQIYLGRVHPDERLVRTLTISSTHDEVMRLNAVTIDGGSNPKSAQFIKVGAKTPLEGGRRWEVELIIGPGLPVGLLSAHAKFAVALKGVRVLQVPVIGNVVPDETKQ